MQAVSKMSLVQRVYLRLGQPASGGKIILPVVQPTLFTEKCKQLQQGPTMTAATRNVNTEILME
jgi:hypothetical protein